MRPKPALLLEAATHSICFGVAGGHESLALSQPDDLMD